MENSRTERQQYLEKLDVTHPEMCPWAEIEEKTLNELQEALEMLKAADTMCRRIQRTCKCPEGSSANLEEEMRWNTSAMVAIVGARPECPQVAAYLTSSSMESQGHVSRPSQSPEVSREFMENPKSQSEDKEKARERLVDSVHALIRALRREARRTGVLQKKLAKMKKILNMPPKEGHGFDDRRHCFHEVSKVSEAKMSIPVATISLENGHERMAYPKPACSALCLKWLMSPIENHSTCHCSVVMTS
ncbi:hypothetical protein I79_004871 [Cricetulus griseus]|uniref:Uncharacterized protein n=1 Tax=Cricetulus griseus TaxID=10029 RepID=G3H3P2_CRIGR|nr:hypothetical protein I79_004871 [Cricetulus griseus]